MIRYSKRHHKKLKPNRAQRQRTAEGQEPRGKGLAKVLCAIRKPLKVSPPQLGTFNDRTGVAHVRESRSLRPEKMGATIRRTGPRAVDTKRSQRLGKTLNQHAS